MGKGTKKKEKIKKKKANKKPKRRKKGGIEIKKIKKINIDSNKKRKM